MTHDESTYLALTLAMVVGLLADTNEDPEIRGHINAALHRMIRDLYDVNITDVEPGPDGHNEFTRALSKAVVRVRDAKETKH